MQSQILNTDTLYSIGEAADVLGVSIPTLRMYEREGLILPYRRDTKHRRYTETDLERIRCIRRTINEEKISIEGMKHLLALIPCWRIKECSPASRELCPAFHQHASPCWMVTGKSLECKNTECRTCTVYTTAAECRTLKQKIAFYTVNASIDNITYPKALSSHA